MAQHVEGNKLVITPDNDRDAKLCEQLEALRKQQCTHPITSRYGTIGTRDTTCQDCGRIFKNVKTLCI